MGSFSLLSPRLDKAGDAVTPSDAVTNSNDQPDATLTYRLPQNATIEPILPFGAFEFERLHGLDLLTVWLTTCLGKELFCKQQRF